MFPQFGSTAESLSKASSLVLRLGTDAHLYDDPDDVSIAPLLDSRFDSDKSEALKRLLALIAQGADVSHFFPQVVKNVASQSLQVKKLVYLYLLHYAEKRQNEALLSINCFQKDLSDTNPLVRAWALRTMAGIRLHVVAPLVLVAVSKCARDPSAYVRKCAANALPKLHDLRQAENDSALEKLVGILLNDHSPGVIAAAAAAFSSICPNNLPLIGKSFKILCETLPDVEEWGQIILIGILLRYVVARHGLVRESIMFNSNPAMTESDNGCLNDRLELDDHNFSVGGETSDAKCNALLFRCYMEGQEEHLSQSKIADGDGDQWENFVATSSQNDDVKLLLRCTSPLLWSQNCGVVLAAAGVHWIMAPRDEVKRIVKPLLFLLRSSYDAKYVILCNIQAFCKVIPSIFAPYFEDFFICSSDSYDLRALKVDILSTIATDLSAPVIFEEFQDYIADPDRRFVADTVAAIGLCGRRLSSVAYTCLEGLLALAVHESSIYKGDYMEGEAGILVQAIMSIKLIVKENPAAFEKFIVQLVRILDAIKEPAARALIVWIVGEYNSVGELIPKIIPTVLRYLAWSFCSEDIETKLQILNTAVKVAVCVQGGDEGWILGKVLSYVLELAKYDLSYDVRDRARAIEKLVEWQNAPSHEDTDICLRPNNVLHVEFVKQFFIGKIQTAYSTANKFRFYLPGSLSQIVLHAAPGYDPLPKPCSLLDSHLNICSDMSIETRVPPMGVSDAGSTSGSSVGESNYDSDSQVSDDSNESDGGGFSSNSHDSNSDGPSTFLVSQEDPQSGTEVPLVHLSDNRVETNPSDSGNAHANCSADLMELMSKTALESWLDEQPKSSSTQNSLDPSAARISINNLDLDVKPKVQTLLDPINRNGLKLECAFSSEISTISCQLVCIDVLFSNCSSEPLEKISVQSEYSDGNDDSKCQISEKLERLLTPNDVPKLLPMDEIASLAPGQTVTRVLQVHFLHHVLPLKLVVLCNNRKYLIKLWPEIGYFMRPLSMNMEAFLLKESQLRGMFEYTKKCCFTNHIDELEHEVGNSSHGDKLLAVSRSLASKVLSNAHVYVVNVSMPISSSMDDASGLCLRFSGEILSSSNPCLLTILAEGKFSGPLELSVKVNCEESIFGLNLLNRVATFLQ